MENQLGDQWPQLPVLEGLWDEVSDFASSVERLRQANFEAKIQPDQNWTRPVPSALRCARLPFYAGKVTLFEVRFEDRFEQGFRICTALLETQKDKSEEQLYLLNGTSPPIHELNAKVPIELYEETVEAYLHFFCGYVWGEDGGFWIVRAPDDLPWLPEVTDENRKEIGTKIRPLVSKGRSNDNGSFLLDATVAYNRTLFFAQFAVQPSGMVEMLDDEPIVSTPIPIREDIRDGVFRVFASAG